MFGWLGHSLCRADSKEHRPPGENLLEVRALLRLRVTISDKSFCDCIDLHSVRFVAARVKRFRSPVAARPFPATERGELGRLFQVFE